MTRKQFPKSIRNEILARQENKCNECKEHLDPRAIDFDHIKPLYKGGINKLSNVQALCSKCHRIKSNTDRIEDREEYEEDEEKYDKREETKGEQEKGYDKDDLNPQSVVNRELGFLEKKGESDEDFLMRI